MGRKPRVEFENGIFHVIQRGNNNDFIFSDELDKGYLIKQLKVLKEKMGYQVFGFVLLDNHYHFMLRTRDQPLQSIMHRVNTRYSKYFNTRYKRTGHVFTGRYRAYPVLEEKYLITLLRYIHQNPVRAGICQRVGDYRWSSDYFYRENISEWVDVDLVMEMIADNREAAVVKYKKLMDMGQKSAVRKSLDELLLETGLSETDFRLIKEGSRKRELTTSKLDYARRALESGYSFNEIGGNIGVSGMAVNDLVNRIAL